MFHLKCIIQRMIDYIFVVLFYLFHIAHFSIHHESKRFIIYPCYFYLPFFHPTIFNTLIVRNLPSSPSSPLTSSTTLTFNVKKPFFVPPSPSPSPSLLLLFYFYLSPLYKSRSASLTSFFGARTPMPCKIHPRRTNS